jgi:hypothetical protein
MTNACWPGSTAGGRLTKNGQAGGAAYDGFMVTKKKAGVAVVNEGGAHGALRRARTKELSPEEEKVMRMRLGASPPRTAPLERSFEGLSDLEIEVRAAEIEAWMRWKARLADGADPARVPSIVTSRAKEKIIRALRKKP